MSLRVKLGLYVSAAVLIIAAFGILTDYRREYQEHARNTLLALKEQVGALRVARASMTDTPGFLRYVEAFSRQWDQSNSPGHHIYILEPRGRILVRSHPEHRHPRIERSLLSTNSAESIFSLPPHRVAQVRESAADGTVIVATQYMDSAEADLRSQLINRAISTAAVTLVVLTVLTVTLSRSVLIPLKLLGATARAWARNEFSVRAPVTGSSDIRALALEFNRMAEGLKQYSEDLQRSNQDLERFAYVASHELKGPLAEISLSLNVLEQVHGPTLDKDARKWIQNASDRAHGMQRLIDDLLNYARASSAEGQFEVVDTTRVLEEALKNCESLIRDNAAEITHDPMPSLVANGDQLAEVFQNLISNAIKYRREEPPRIHVGVAQRPDTWLFQVRDNGLGIPAEGHERIFRMFQRIHTGVSGTGIGLAICERIVERHGGRIWVESEPQKGSTFFFTLPTTHRVSAHTN
jgi:signal transduction histidine kinase